VLIISAFAEDFLETRATVIGRLAEKGLHVGRDIRPHAESAGPNCWISRKLDESASRVSSADRILCHETEWQRDPLDDLQTLFSALLVQAPHPEEPAWSVHMPLIGTGDKGGDPEATLKLIVLGFQEAFANGLNVRSVRIIVRDPERFRELQRTFRSLRDSYNPFEVHGDTKPRWKLFVSYSQKNKGIVHPVYENLRSRIAPDVFIDYETRGQANEGMILSRDLALAVRQSRAMIAIISPEYVASPYCRLEFATAYTLYYQRKGGFSLKPIFLSDPGSFPAEYRNVMGDTWHGPETLSKWILEFCTR
jgi:hypothetical protein